MKVQGMAKQQQLVTDQTRMGMIFAETDDDLAYLVFVAPDYRNPLYSAGLSPLARRGRDHRHCVEQVLRHVLVQVAARDAAEPAQRLREQQRRLRRREALLLRRGQPVAVPHELAHQLHELPDVVGVELARGRG